jgi:peptidoglycan hydrolase CwlO-like protein
MDGNIAGWVATGVLSASTIIGWISIVRKASADKALGAASEAELDATSKAHLNALEKKVDSLPCTINPNYMKEMGAMQEQVRQVDKNVDELTKSISGLNRRIDDALKK